MLEWDQTHSNGMPHSRTDPSKKPTALAANEDGTPGDRTLDVGQGKPVQGRR
jgi:hypothetical protein